MSAVVPTLLDISRAAGVSVKTVSRALRGEGYVAPETLVLVRRCARKLGYRPNRAARGLKMGRLQEVVLVMWSIEAMGEAGEIYMAKIRALDEVVRAKGMPLTIRMEGGGRERTGFPEKLLFDLEADRPLGVVFLPTNAQVLQRAVERLEAVGVATVVMDAMEEGAFDNIAVDRGAGIAEAIHYLFEVGRRDICYVGPGEAGNRLEGYERGMADVGLRPRYHYLSPSGLSEALYQQGRDAARNLMGLESPPDAVIAYSDPVALGMIDALKEGGFSLPRDLSIVGFDDKSAAVLTTPRLTTIAHPNAEVGRLAGEVLLEKIKGRAEPKAGWSFSLPARLVVRESA